MLDENFVKLCFYVINQKIRIFTRVEDAAVCPALYIRFWLHCRRCCRAMRRIREKAVPAAFVARRVFSDSRT